MKRLLLATLVLALALSACGPDAANDNAADLAAGRGEVPADVPEQGAVSAEPSQPEEEFSASRPDPVSEEAFEPEPAPQSDPASAIIPDPEIPLSSTPLAEVSEETTELEEPGEDNGVPSLPELASEYSYAGTLLRPEENIIVEAPPQVPAAVSQSGIDTAEFEEELFRLINREREARGESALGMEEHLRWAAGIRAEEVVAELSHTRPDGTSYYTAFDEAGFEYAGKWHGENVSRIQFTQEAYTSREAAAHMFEQLAASSGHLNNMISQHYAQIGIGAAMEIRGDVVTISSAQLFAGF